MNVQGISVFVQIDGHKCFAPIDAESMELFVRMLPSFQPSQDGNPYLLVLPKEAAEHAEAAGRAIAAAIQEKQKAKG